MRSKNWVTAVVANHRGEIFDLEGYAALGSDGMHPVDLTVDRTRPLPHGSELMRLPDRIPLLYDIHAGQVVALAENPYAPGEPIYPVAAFNSPGYIITLTCAYEEMGAATHLPLFSYGAAGWHGEGFRSAVIQVDDEPRQDLRRMPIEKVEAGISTMRARMPDNRLRAHLENCALTYGCPAGKNFFLGRYEAPLPSATTCNARCLGCLSQQSDSSLSCSQDRIQFTPSPEEIAEVALAHIGDVDKAVVSFGQGCEGDPLTAADTLVEAIKMIRTATAGGTINMNTNGSLPDKIDQLLDAGLDSLRISMNSVRPDCYHAYFRPRGYTFNHVVESIDRALARGAHVAVNYLNCPGFTDTPGERAALIEFINAHPIRMIQWRNLNFDPLRYVRLMKETTGHEPPTGIARLLEDIRDKFPDLCYGYFNPPKEHFGI